MHHADHRFILFEHFFLAHKPVDAHHSIHARLVGEAALK
jgi:hypothetical protein